MAIVWNSFVFLRFSRWQIFQKTKKFCERKLAKRNPFGVINSTLATWFALAYMIFRSHWMMTRLGLHSVNHCINGACSEWHVCVRASAWGWKIHSFLSNTDQMPTKKANHSVSFVSVSSHLNPTKPQNAILLLHSSSFSPSACCGFPCLPLSVRFRPNSPRVFSCKNVSRNSNEVRRERGDQHSAVDRRDHLYVRKKIALTASTWFYY